jgi:hypothetical protein
LIEDPACGFMVRMYRLGEDGEASGRRGKQPRFPPSGSITASEGILPASSPAPCNLDSFTYFANAAETLLTELNPF